MPRVEVKDATPLRTRRAASAGFSVLELLVAIFIIGVLISIAIPALRSARLAAQRTASLTHQREVGQTLLHYAHDHNGAFPYFGVPGTYDITPPTYNGRPVTGANSYWSQSNHWGRFLQNEGYDVEFTIFSSAPGYLSRTEGWYGNQPEQASNPDLLTLTAFANPAYWSRPGPRDPVHHQPQRWSSVRHPSLKGILYRTRLVQNIGEWPPQYPHFLWAADGHARLIYARDIRPGVALVPHFSDGARSPHVTEHGLHGRDL